MGATSGAAFSVAKWYHRKYPEKVIVVLLPDNGYRYQDTIYNDKWLKDNNLYLDILKEEPTLVSSPKEAEINKQWSRFLWNNRTYEEFLKEEKN